MAAAAGRNASARQCRSAWTHVLGRALNLRGLAGWRDRRVVLGGRRPGRTDAMTARTAPETRLVVIASQVTSSLSGFIPPRRRLAQRPRCAWRAGVGQQGARQPNRTGEGEEPQAASDLGLLAADEQAQSGGSAVAATATAPEARHGQHRLVRRRVSSRASRERDLLTDAGRQGGFEGWARPRNRARPRRPRTGCTNPGASGCSSTK